VIVGRPNSSVLSDDPPSPQNTRVLLLGVFSGSRCFTVRACDHDNVPVGIAYPEFPVAWGGIDVDLLDDLGTKCTSAPDDGVKIIHLEPEENAVSVWSRVCTHQVRMVFFVPGVELKNQSSFVIEPIVKVTVIVLPEVLDAE
jgi:hypothetical protein